MDYWDYQAKKTGPRPSHERKVTDPRPVMEQVRPPEPIEVSEIDTSDTSETAVQRIIKKWKGEL